MSQCDDYEIEKKIIETLIGPVIMHDAVSFCTILRFKGGGHVTIGEVKTRLDYYGNPYNGTLYSASDPQNGIVGSGWCYVPQATLPIMWPPCSFADFLQRLSDPETRKKHGLPPL